ncbi:protein of unknown function [Pseudodesulfovibrio profundus]|jgi:hypothetical protein|uniref:Uncharacterized protein n=1 Tax=Pseudodesulfovibrio profundus TaxID=57320 RepID=A0A2C8F501_9BACT|nr:hypothetical protein [Pseudodesulfovibrio profundus]SOB57456.1 protein of unknown function [Pseudodesulfovibrio profundus]
MKNPILVPEFREYLSHNSIEALREICEAEHLAVVARGLAAPAASLIPFKPSILGQSPFQPFEGGVRHD